MAPTTLEPLSAGGVGNRRKHFPKLPASAFSPNPATGSSSNFDSSQPPATSKTDVQRLVDSHVVIASNDDLDKLRSAYSQLGSSVELDGLVAVVPSLEAYRTLESRLSDASAKPPVRAVVSTISTQDPEPTISAPSTSSAPLTISLSIPKAPSETQRSALSSKLEWALKAGHNIELEIEDVPTAADRAASNLVLGAKSEDDEGVLEYVGAIVLAALKGASSGSGSEGDASTTSKGSIIFRNVLPPPHVGDIDIDKLAEHSEYQAYQQYIASLSLLPNSFIKLIPPTWSSVSGAAGSLSDAQITDLNRRVKMFVTPAIEAFGYARVLYGSSASHGPSAILPSDWFALVRESVQAAEEGVESSSVQAVFLDNAKRAYGF